jgi:hypothetical protein
MFLSRLAFVGIVVTTLVSGQPGGQTVDNGAASPEGTWEIITVVREGNFDPTQKGAKMVFKGNVVKFQPNLAQAMATFG